MIKVKICGITNLEDALAASFLGADAIGFIFSRRSPRFVNEKAAKKIIDSLDPFLIKVGVFLDQDKEEVLGLASRLHLDVLQFHGSEAPAYCRFFKPGFKIIKTIFPEEGACASTVSRYNVDAFLFDIKYEDKQRGDKVLSPSAIEEIKSLVREKRIIISGGLNPKNLSRIKKIKPYAVDVASGLEKMVGKKDEKLMEKFINEIRH
ncbi:MAG: phosphoribosylanthranilate isomerase [Candidatus Omnitrophota bacterium]|jgi:phosphoribosylanthranilate isomerase